MGPYHGSQQESVRMLRERAAIWIASSPLELSLALRALLGDGAARAARVAAALEVVAAQRGAAKRAVALLAGIGLWPRP